MDARFGALVETLAPKLELLIRCPPLSDGELPQDMPLSEVYLFSEAGRHLYVGLSNGLWSRYSRHCRPGGDPSPSRLRVPARTRIDGQDEGILQGRDG